LFCAGLVWRIELPGNKAHLENELRGRGIALGWLSAETVTVPAWWTLGEAEAALHQRGARSDALSETEQAEEERPCWWVLSALDGFDGKEAREAYYAKF
jgi:hypothetical protein